METKRRALLTEPGEPLIVSLSPIESAIRYGQFAQATGIPRSSLAVSPLCSIPLPVYPTDFGAPRRWPSVRPESMWHPLLWLPPRLTQRYQVGELATDLEDDDLWSVRVALEMSACGLYDDTSGTWVDVLSLIDIDIDSADGIERLNRWLGGQPDLELDGLGHQIEALLELTETDRDWAASTAAASLDALRVSAWAFTADSLFDICLDLGAGRVPGKSNSDLKLALEMVANFALVSFTRSPRGHPADEPENDYWSRVINHLSTLASGDDISAMPILDDVQHHLGALRDLYWPRMLVQADTAS